MPKEYGGHKYADHDGTSDCSYGCGCWMGPSRSGSRLLGISPGGVCPKNPKDGELLGGEKDHHYVVEQRIERLVQALSEAEIKLKQVEPDKVQLAEDLASARTDLSQKEKLLTSIRQLLGV